MDEKQLENMWNYFLSLEQDLSNTSRYVEPQGQENVYSFEFAKIIILACTEVESAFKQLCKLIDGNDHDRGRMDTDYNPIILGVYPKIVDSEVYISRLGRTEKPFENWNSSSLSWWRAYNKIKHNRDSYFQKATYENAVLALSALYILILYLSEIIEKEVNTLESNYIRSPYMRQLYACRPNNKLPDFKSEDQ